MILHEALRGLHGDGAKNEYDMAIVVLEDVCVSFTTFGR